MDKEKKFLEFESVDSKILIAFMIKHPNDYDYPNAEYSDFKEWFLKFQKEWNDVCSSIDNKLSLL